MQCMNDEGASLLVFSICFARRAVAALSRQKAGSCVKYGDLRVSGSSESMHSDDRRLRMKTIDIVHVKRDS